MAFMVGVFIVYLNNYNMVLVIKWFAKLGNIMSNYKDLWMSFNWLC